MLVLGTPLKNSWIFNWKQVHISMWIFKSVKQLWLVMQVLIPSCRWTMREHQCWNILLWGVMSMKSGKLQACGCISPTMHFFSCFSACWLSFPSSFITLRLRFVQISVMVSILNQTELGIMFIDFSWGGESIMALICSFPATENSTVIESEDCGMHTYLKYIY